MKGKKVLGKIPCELMPKDRVIELKLDEQPYHMIIPKSDLKKLKITADKINFDLVLDENKICLVGPNY